MGTTVAFTVQDAVRQEASQLRLVHRRLAALPADLSNLTSLTSLDLSDNPIKALQPQDLPDCLKELELAGCQLSGCLPYSLTSLTALEQLVVSANHLCHADAVFACQHLVHAGLAYNHISSLSVGHNQAKVMSMRSSSATSSTCSNGAAGLTVSPIMCLDLSHNDMTDLRTTLQQLQLLPKLRALHLKGNPLNLLPHYKAAVLQNLPLLVYLDGQKLDDLRHLPAASAPVAPPVSTAASGVSASMQICSTSQQPEAPAGASTGAATAGPTAVDHTPAGADKVNIALELDKLQVLESSATVFAALAAGAAVRLRQLLQQHGIQLPSQAASAGDMHQGPSAVPAAVGSSGSSGANTARFGLDSLSLNGSSSNGSSSAGAANGADAGGSADASLLQQLAPLLPIRYHLEVHGPDGCGYCSAAAVVVSPPTPAEGCPAATGQAGLAAPAPAAADMKKAALAKAGKDVSKGAAASKARPGSSARPSVAKGLVASAEAQQGGAVPSSADVTGTSDTQPGCLRVKLCVSANVATRDWLRSGFEVRLVRTTYQPHPVLPQLPEDPQTSAAQPATGETPAAAAAMAPPSLSLQPTTAAATPRAAGTTAVSKSAAAAKLSGGSTASSSGANTVAEGPDPAYPAVSWQQHFKQDNLGIAQVCTPGLVEATSAGQPLDAAGSAAFMPPPPLLHPTTHIRLGLAEAKQQQQQPVGSCIYKVVLHV